MSEPLGTDLASLLAQSPLFSIFEKKETLAAILRKFHAVRFSLGSDILRKGEPGDSLFVVYSGEVRVVGLTPEQREVTLATLGPGEFFGEQSLLTGEPRAATIRAKSDVVLMRLDGKDFKKIVAADEKAKHYLERYISRNGVRNFIRQFTVFSALTTQELRLLLDHLEFEKHEKGKTIFRQGDPGDKFYLVLKGQAAVLKKNKEEAPERIATLGEGRFFGELALISDQPRAATITAETDLEVAVLDKESFKKFFEKSEKLRQKFRGVMGLYASEEAPRQTPPPAPPQPPPSEESPFPQPPDGAGAGPRPSGRFKWIAQQDETDCAAACLAMLCRHYGKRLSLTRLRDLCNVGREGATLLSLAAAAEGLGFQTRGIKTTYDLLRQAQLPAVAHWKGFHYIVVYRMSENEAWVADPALGLKKIPRNEFEEHWSGMALLLTPTPELEKQPEKKRVLARFLPLLSPHKLLLAEALGCAFLLNLFGLTTPLFIQTIVDRVVVHQDLNLLTILLIGMLLVAFFQVAASALRQYLLIHVTNRVDLTLLTSFFRHLFSLPLRFFKVRKVGDILARVEENAKIRAMLTDTLVSSILDALMVVIYLGVMLVYNLKLTAVSLALMPISILLTLVLTPIFKRMSREIFAKNAESNSYLVEALNGVAAVKAGAAEREVRWKWEELFVRYIRQVNQAAMLDIGTESIGEVLNGLSTVLLLWYGSLLIIRGEMTIGQLMAFNALIGSVIGPMVRLIRLYDKFQDFLISVERLNDVFDAPPEQEASNPSLLRLPKVKGHLKFENVSFAYEPASPPVLKNLTFEAFPGQTVAIVGRSGSGKTTLANLILRFYAAGAGRITLDGYDLKDFELGSLRRHVGIVLQENFLFSGTIRDNIALGHSEASFDQIVEAATMAAAHEFIIGFPLGYETIVGERGASLSGGQRQRIAIARALLGRPQILILDEATSSLDNESERAIQRNMGGLLKGRTALVIAHRMTTVQNADMILVLDQGMIVERGRHQELIEAQGLYYYLNNQALAL